jgi:superfamily II DNA or RNA helicase
MTRAVPKTTKYLLWIMQDGCCAICGKYTSIDDFESDHKNPWSKSKDSSLLNLQGTCSECNGRKGVNSWRKHQKDLITIADLMRYTPTIRDVIAWVTPGGGKSALPVILAKHLIPTCGQRIAWITPRDNLRSQGETAFLDDRYKSLLGHNIEIRATMTEPDPCRSTKGFITTYHSISSDFKGSAKIFEREFRTHSYLLVLDESHHVAIGSEFHRALQPLWDLAARRLIMTGCLDRSDGDYIAFLPYLPLTNDGKAYVDQNDTPDRRFIKYDLRDALRERAIIPMWFELLDGNASWESRGAEFRKDKISEVDNGEIGSAIYTTLRTDFAFHLLQQTVEHWRTHKLYNPRSLLLVVAPTIALAQKYLRWVRTMGITRADIAVSEDSQLARDNIEAFKTGNLDVLVTVAMAYEGMDAPRATHIACLTHIRARPWIEQMLARATRFDEKAGPWEHQRAWIFAPDDQLFQQVMKDMNEIQEPFVKEGIGHGPGGHGPSIITPISSGVDAMRAGGLDPTEQVNATEHAGLVDAMKRSGLFGIATELQAKMFKEAMNNPQPSPISSSRPEPISVREKRLKDQIDTWIKGNFYRGDGEIMKEINTEIIRRYGKSRPTMNEQELRKVWDERMIWAAQFLGRQT